MKNLLFLGSILLLPLTGRAVVSGTGVRNDSLSVARFGKIALYEPATAPSSVVLFISGDGGWKSEVVDMAKIMCGQGALVAGVDIRRYYREVNASAEKCFYPAGDLEELGKVVQQFAHLPLYQAPILAGASSGATLVYAALAEAPEGTFAGGLSMGFCADMEIGKEPCRGNGLNAYRVTKPSPAWMLEPDPALKTPWYLLHGKMDQCCLFDKTERFAGQIPAARLVPLPKVGHGFAIDKNWAGPFQSAFGQLVHPGNENGGGIKSLPPRPSAGNPGLPDASGLSDLPLVLTPAKSGSSGRMAVLLSGDGGWKAFDQGIADGLAARGIPVVGLNTLQYFWNARTPEDAAWDLTRILRSFQRQWSKKEVLLVGYSFGADVLPFLYNRLNDQEKSQVKAMVLLSPESRAEFDFHFSSWLNQSAPDAKPLAPELEKMRRCPTLFLFGDEEDTRWVEPMIKDSFTLKTLEGGHHYSGNTSGIAALIHSF